MAGTNPPPSDPAEVLRPTQLSDAAAEGPSGNPTTTTLKDETLPRAHGDTDHLLRPPEASDELGRLGDYRVLRLLSEGGMGLVFEAEDANLGRRVALKVIRPEQAGTSAARLRFMREARAAAAIEHDHIVTVFQVGEDNHVPFLAMQLLQGESLAERLRRHGPLPIAEVVRIAREAAEGLAAAHARGLIHRDVKPANIFLERAPTRPEGRVKLLDFGLARRTDAAAAGLTHAGLVIGTPGYMAPEQARHEQVDPRSDVFSLGCVIHQMASGEEPFTGASPINRIMAQILDPVPNLTELREDVPPALADLVERMLAKDPQGRPASAAAVSQELAAIEKELSRPTAAATEWAEAPDPVAAPRPRVPTAPGARQTTPVALPRPANRQPPARPATNTPAAKPGLCPRCANDLRTMGEKSWCLRCGYSSMEEEQLAAWAAQPRPRQTGVVPFWAYFMFAGCLAIFIVTMLRGRLFAAGSATLTWWILLEAGIGLLLYVLGHAWVITSTYGQWEDGGVFFRYLDPMNIAKYAIVHLPRTRAALCCLSWGLTAFLCALVLFCRNDFVIKDKSQKAKAKPAVIYSQGASPSDTGEADAADYASPDALPGEGRDSDAGLDLPSDPDHPELGRVSRSEECVVIGYVPDPDDPNRISQVVIGMREEDGTVRYAGTVNDFAKTGETDGLLDQVRKAKKLPQAPAYLPGDVKAVPVEPGVACRVKYGERTSQGVLKNTILVGGSSPQAPK
jgi:serine/threonine protein kinase